MGDRVDDRGRQMSDPEKVAELEARRDAIAMAAREKGFDSLAHEIESQKFAGSPRIWSGIDLYRAKLSSPEGQVAGKALCRKSVSLLLGEGGVGKTYIAMAIGRAAVLGGDLGHVTVKPGRVLFLSEEMSDDEMHGRLHELFREEELEKAQSDIRFRCRSGIAADTEEGIAALRDLIESEGRPEYVFIDALVDIHSKNENSNSEMGPVFRNLRDLVATPCDTSITVLHHAGKPGEFLSGSNRSRGASVIRDICADVILVEARRSSMVRDVRFSKCRHGGANPPKPFTTELVEENGIFTIAVGDEDSGAGDFAKGGKVVKLVTENGGRMLRHALIDTLKQTEGWSERTADKAIAEAVGSGLLKRGEKIGREVPYETD